MVVRQQNRTTYKKADPPTLEEPITYERTVRDYFKKYSNCKNARNPNIGMK